MSHAEGAENAELVYTQRTQRAQSLCAAQRYPCHPCETFALGGTQQHLRNLRHLCVIQGRTVWGRVTPGVWAR